MQMMQAKHKAMMGSGAMMPSKGDAGPSSLAFTAINAQMHQAMAITFTGDFDVDFAKVVLGFGKDPEIRKLAENVIKAQEAEITQMAEIAQMNAWLKAKGQLRPAMMTFKSGAPRLQRHNRHHGPS